MAHKVFISFKTEDKEYKRIIQEELAVDMIDKSLNESINSEDVEYIMWKIRHDYLQDSTVTIALIGRHSAESLHPCPENQVFIKRELQASLYSGSVLNSRNGILAVILPSMYDKVYPAPGIATSQYDGKTINVEVINDSTAIKEISENFYLDSPLHNSEIDYWTDDERYVVSVKWDDFTENPNEYIDKAFEKRSASVANYVKVRPK